MDGAAGYVLQRATSVEFVSPAKVYEGEKTTYLDLEAFGTGKIHYYRVQAKGVRPWSRDSASSNVVQVPTSAGLR